MELYPPKIVIEMLQTLESAIADSVFDNVFSIFSVKRKEKDFGCVPTI